MIKKNNDLTINETMPHQISAPSWKGSGIKMKPPFVNEQGVVIGDSNYNSAQSPLNNWSDEIDPEVMTGDEWIHPTNDIGWNTPENRQLVEEKKMGQNGLFMHPDKDVGYEQD
ncbi:DUF3905 domain-containing protein [Metabacillus arenae]|uniref:DUF3905 domain-containing protein n=1 Tax=Metabacillus arenae TaxID=2771434 RepID=A0A926RX68_9BACI|nr:DUF3905 domain-containing protein [Metabacillus arenae]MBD1380345.1 DUF3905 domain-containing protein [Metabacillus arenae]